MSAGDTEQSLDGAYTLQTPEDSVNLYRGWAETYDQDFAASHHYIVPDQVASMFRDEGGAGPILDIGAGTGLVGEALAKAGTGGPVDAIDISGEMLAVAESKGAYRSTIQADLTQPLEIADGAYNGFTSAGTFTHGHVGPGCLPELMRIAAPGALFVLSINAEVFDSARFGSAFAELVARGQISPVSFRVVQYYAEGAAHDHAEDTGLAAIFRRL